LNLKFAAAVRTLPFIYPISPDNVTQFHLLFIVEEREKETRAYRVDLQYETFWSAAKANNYCSIMPIFDTADNMVNPDHFAEKLVGAMCEITFTLKHYAIGAQTKANGNVVEANDVFSHS
jgi:hypothetical protein